MERQIKRRKGVPKSKAGCRTCRIRHIKCDEGKPACNRCSSTGRICEFTNPHSTSPLTRTSSSRRADRLITDHSPNFSVQKFVLRPKPYPSGHVPPQEVTHFDYFRLVCAKNFSGYFENRLWESLFLQLSHREQSIRYAIVAIGALYRQNVHKSDNSGEEASLYYGKALKVLNQRLDNSESSWEIALFGSILFMVFEVLRGSDLGALQHLEGAFGLMKEFITKFPILPGNLQELSSALTKFNVQASTYAMFYTPKALKSPVSPPEFSSIIEARDSLQTIVAYMHHLFKNKSLKYQTLPYIAVPPQLVRQANEIQTLLDQWITRFNAFQSQEKPEFIGSNVLLVQHICTKITISTIFYRDEIAFDAFQKEFAQIVSLATAVVRATPLDQRFSFAVDTGIVEPLFRVAFKCRHPIIRRQAIDLLERAGREGIWDGQTAAAGARWIMAQEEEGLEGDDIFVPEEKRFRFLACGVDRKGKKMRLDSTTRNPDRTLKYVVGHVTWGDQAEAAMTKNEEDDAWKRRLGSNPLFVQWRQVLESSII